MRMQILLFITALGRLPLYEIELERALRERRQGPPN